MNKLLSILFIYVIFILSSSSIYADDSAKAIAQNNFNLVHNALKEIKDIPPLPENWKEIVENGIRNILKDPESARFRYPDEQQKYCALSNSKVGPIKPITSHTASPLTGYSGIVFVNAKNSFGGYTGESPFWYMITDGKLSLIKEVQTEKSGVLASLYTPINSIKDIENSPLRWEGNHFMCKN